MSDKYTFFDNSTLTEFWNWVKILLQMASPAVLIAVAILAVGLLIPIIIRTLRKGSKEQYQGSYDMIEEDEDSFKRRTDNNY